VVAGEDLGEVSQGKGKVEPGEMGEVSEQDTVETEPDVPGDGEDDDPEDDEHWRAEQEVSEPLFTLG